MKCVPSYDRYTMVYKLIKVYTNGAWYYYALEFDPPLAYLSEHMTLVINMLI